MGHSQYLHYPLSYRDIEGLLLERSLEVDRSTVNYPIPPRNCTGSRN